MASIACIPKDRLPGQHKPQPIPHDLEKRARDVMLIAVQILFLVHTHASGSLENVSERIAPAG